MGARKQSKPVNLDKARDDILVASLPHVVFDGWSAKALAAGARDSGHGPTGLARAFPGGARDVALHFGDWVDRRMAEAVGKKFHRKPLRGHEKVVLAVEERLRILAPHREAVRRLLAFLARPGNAGAATTMLWRSADAVWRLAGDASTDFNHYTKRGLLAGVYASTLLFWLDDDSDHFADTDAFLDRRIADVMKIFALRGRMKGFTNGFAAAGRVKAAVARFAPSADRRGPIHGILRRAARVRDVLRRAG